MGVGVGWVWVCCFNTSDGRPCKVYVHEVGKQFYVDWEEQVSVLTESDNYLYAYKTVRQ